MAETLATLTLRRTYPVSPDRVWRAWIEPDAMRVWFGQSEAKNWDAQLDLRVGGRYRFTMENRGQPFVAHGVYRELEPGRRLVFTWNWHALGGAGPGAMEAVIRVELHPVAGGTELEFQLDPMTDPRERDAWRADFSRLGALLRDK